MFFSPHPKLKQICICALVRGQGANEAMLDAVEITSKIIEASKGGKSYAEALREYEEEMIPRGIRAIEGSRMAWNNNQIYDEKWRDRVRN